MAHKENPTMGPERGGKTRPGGLWGVLLLFSVLVLVEAAGAQRRRPTIVYEVTMDQPHTHYFDVAVTVTGLKKKSIDFVMPVWTPGSYLVREFAKNVQELTAIDGQRRSLTVQKIAKHSWRVTSNRVPQVTVRYRVYAYEVSVRTSFLDDSHGYINGASVFVYVDGYQDHPVTLKIKPYPGWERVSTGLEPVPGQSFTYQARSYDILVDCPIEIGNQQIYTFDVQGVPHYVSIYGVGNYEPDTLVADMKKVVEQGVALFGGMPYQHYTFLVQLLESGGGGLEHLNSTSLQTNRWTFKPPKAYLRWLGLVAHEYFHLWNVKRIRPKTLGPFDYKQENYTSLLWVAEGFTSYYASMLLRRADLLSPPEFLDQLAGRIGSLQQTPGRLFQSVAEASFDAWIKYYRRNENSPNATISYYTKGAVIAMLLDLEIRHRTQNGKTLDDVMRFLFATYAQRQGRGFTEQEFRAACERLAGGSLEDLFRYVETTEEIDYNRYLAYTGLRLEVTEGPEEADSQEGYLGVRTRMVDGKLRVTQVLWGTPAYEYGLNVDDEIIALDGIRVDASMLAKRIGEKRPGDRVRITLARRGLVRDMDLVLGTPPPTDYRLVQISTPTPEQQACYEQWVGASWEAE